MGDEILRLHFVSLRMTWFSIYLIRWVSQVMANKPSFVADVLAEVFKRGGMRRGVKRAEAVLLWPQVVGANVAKFTTARSVQDGTLFVEVTDSETAMHLSFQRQKFLNVYQAKFGVKDIKEVRFRVGRPSVPDAPREKRPEAPVDPKALAAVARQLGALALPDDLSRPTMQAAKAMLAYRSRRLAEGWTPCAVCETLLERGALCAVCTRYGESRLVQRASHQLALDPAGATPMLSDDERRVAVYLARAYLKEKLQELLPHVLADPTYKPHLESAARCYLAHLLERPLTEISDADFDRLDPRIARALGRWR